MQLNTKIEVQNLVTSASILASAIFIAYQVRAKRTDERWAKHLERIDAQLSDLYGPLFALFESGDQEWRAFRAKYCNNRDDPHFLGFFPTNLEEPEFMPPDATQLSVFRTWTKAVFLATNTRMAELMIEHAELLIGKVMPEPFLKFCVHVTSLQANVASWDQEGFDKSDWKQHLAIFPHPAAELHNYIRASFTVLKETQSELLARKCTIIDERKLEERIRKEITRLQGKETERREAVDRDRALRRAKALAE